MLKIYDIRTTCETTSIAWMHVISSFVHFHISFSSSPPFLLDVNRPLHLFPWLQHSFPDENRAFEKRGQNCDNYTEKVLPYI